MAEVMKVDNLKSGVVLYDCLNYCKYFHFIPAGITLNRQSSSATESIERRLMFSEEQIDMAWVIETCAQKNG
jgi:hypothetical protein